MSEIYENTGAKQGAKQNKIPVLSVLIPYYRDDPGLCLQNLLKQSGDMAAVEILLYDDGTNNAPLNETLRIITKTAPAPVRLFCAAQNKGRSYARNFLLGQARAKWVLFLDADMLPVDTNFIARYREKINANNTDILFGGFVVPETASSRQTELHRVLALRSDCHGAAVRSLAGPQYVCTSNLCVRKEVLVAEAFDTDFTGWGWEDSEWAARVATSYRLTHIDNPALHTGLESTQTLLARFRDSAGNYVKFTNKHPKLAKTLRLYKLAQRLKYIPGQGLLRPLLALLVRNPFGSVPMKFRLAALKLWRASWYGKAMR